jgi:DNA-binding transcriptional ArsR family regulator
VRGAAPLFAALGDPTRLGIFVQVASGGPQSIKGLSERGMVSRQAVTKHLYVLSEAGLLRSSRRGRQHIWEIEPERLADARAYLGRIDADWDAALGRLRALLEGGPDATRST